MSVKDFLKKKFNLPLGGEDAGLSGSEKSQFKAMLLKANILRLTAAAACMIPIQLLNLIFGEMAGTHGRYQPSYRIAELFLLAVSVLGLLFMLLCRRGKVGQRYAEAVVCGFWLLISVGMLSFSCIEASEIGSLSNFVVLSIMLSVIPFFRFFASLVLLPLGTAVMLAHIIGSGLPVDLVQQALVIGAANMLISQLFFMNNERSCADRIRLAAANRQLVELNCRMSELVCTDELTLLTNRRGLTEELLRMKERCRRESKAFAAIMVDIDNFKAFNDANGHQAGDACLSRIAETLRSDGRPYDVTARYGGEEFLILCADVTREQLAAIAERHRRRVEDLRIPAADTSVSEWVTVSLGAAMVDPGSDVTDDMLVRRADEALYRAKNEGKNRFVIS